MQCNEIRNHFTDFVTEDLDDSAQQEFGGHLKECSACRDELEALTDLWVKLGSVPPGEPPSLDLDVRLRGTLEEYQQQLHDKRAIRPVSKRPPALVAVAAAVAVALAVFLPVVLWPSRAPVLVERVDGGLYRATKGQAESLRVGEELEMGVTIHSNGESGGTLLLADGSRLEMRRNSELSLESVDDGVRIRLNRGGIIVNAAQQPAGRHLYVWTKDVTVSVVGTVFLVNAEEEGSRVTVIEGEVRVKQGETEKSLRPGEQVTTNPVMEPQPVVGEISWSRNAEAHMALLQQSVAAERRPPEPQFEVISIRQESDNPGMRGARVRCNAVDGIFPAPGRGAPPAESADASNVARGRCAGRYVTLVALVATAYGVPDRNVSGGPDWVRSMYETFQIEAKAETPATVTRVQLREMLKKMLVGRFKLEIRRETRDASGYAVVVAASGPQLQKASGEEDLYLSQDGRRNQFNLMGGGQISIKGKSTLKSFADYLATAPLISLNHVADGTDLPGMFEFSLTLHMVPPELAVAGGGPRGGGSARSGPRVEWDPSISHAMEKQLGLTLKPQRVSEEVIVIQYVEKPSEN